MKTIIFIAMFLLCMSVVLADSGISIANVDYDSNFMRMSILSENDLTNARAKIIIPELGVVMPAKNIDLREDTSMNMIFPIDGEIPEGEYLVRISVKKGNQRRIVHRFVYFS